MVNPHPIYTSSEVHGSDGKDATADDGKDTTTNGHGERSNPYASHRVVDFSRRRRRRRRRIARPVDAVESFGCDVLPRARDRASLKSTDRFDSFASTRSVRPSTRDARDGGTK